MHGNDRKYGHVMIFISVYHVSLSITPFGSSLFSVWKFHEKQCFPFGVLSCGNLTTSRSGSWKVYYGFNGFVWNRFMTILPVEVLPYHPFLDKPILFHRVRPLVKSQSPSCQKFHRKSLATRAWRVHSQNYPPQILSCQVWASFCNHFLRCSPTTWDI